MDTVHIDWGEGVIRFDSIGKANISRLDEKGFYAILGAVYNSEKKYWENLKLLYVGQAFDQTLRERIPQEHSAYECAFDYQRKHSGVGIVVMLGTIKNSIVEKLTQQFFDDIECCLVYCNRPLCNTSCQETYTGRTLMIINEGNYSPLKEECDCSEK